MSMSINLEKGQKICLTKTDNTLKKLQIGLGWKTQSDLDAIAFLADEDGDIKETVYFGDKNHKGIYLNGDDLVGGKKGDCEIIFVTFDDLPKYVTRIHVCVNIFSVTGFHLFSAKDFSKIKESYVRLVNSDTNEELCRYDLREDGKGCDAFHFADLYKENDGTWHFEAIGKGMKGQIASLRVQLNGKVY